ncbi:MAG: hypothetical protein F4246_11075 [Rhodothermaceae bacterium]|nr:hypothetical protein [Rhodothermaceae bacterium]MYJ56272.1 hypothetical protein [Rhodothermaceae bacterium]
MTRISRFLSGLIERPWAPLPSAQLRPVGLYIGKGPLAMEVAVAFALKNLSDGEIKKTWKARKGGRGSPLLLIILHSDIACLCGATGDDPSIYRDLDPGLVERLCRELLDQPDRHSALRLLAQTLSSFDTSLPGLRNEGLLALHELEYGVPKRTDLGNARKKAQAALNLRGGDLLRALGFSIEPLDSLTSVLRSNDRKTALAVMLHENESVEQKEHRFNQLSPVSYAFRKADNEDLKWIIFTQKNRIRLYATDITVGVGRRGRTETYIECQPWLLSDEQLHYLWLLYSAEALIPGGSLHQLLDGSTRFAGNLAKELRERIYEHVVPVLAQGIVHARGGASNVEDLALTYEMALTVLFRLLFVAYAEDRDLLPYRHNDAYRRRSLKEKAKELANAIAKDIPIAKGSTHWRETVDLWEAVARGNIEWDVPAYGGGLFLDDESVSTAGAAISRITLPNECFEVALRDLLVIKTSEGIPGPVDFRSLGVREFGTIYEGLLDSGIARADMDLVLKKQKKAEVYVPAKSGQKPAVSAGEVYLHNRSGARKSSGSYYTKSFAVEHLIGGSLEPALRDHFARLDELDESDASEAFFDFRVADVAMGSGHFLISAVDLMEKKMADYLADRPLPDVMNELGALRSIAMDRIRGTHERDPIENSQLLRRLIARRCIYGVDLNPLAVQLARLAVWIHTFVPGLPLSFLDRTLIQGNALVGMGSIAEIRIAFANLSSPLYINANKLLGRAKKPLRRLANNNDSSLADVEKARNAQEDVRVALQDTEMLFDLLTAAPIGGNSVIKEVLNEWEKLSDPLNVEDPGIQEALNSSSEDLQHLSVVHFPIVFPEVFLRKRPGFDVILGNPPWEKVKVDENAFWARHFPGLRGKSQREQEVLKERLREERPDLITLYERELEETYNLRKALVSGSYPGIGTGDPDLYKAFCWRFWRLSRTYGGVVGVVLPRSAIAAKGSEDFRKVMFAEATNVEVITLTNRAGWIFDEVEHRYTIALLCAQHGKSAEGSISLRGPFTSLASFKEGITNKPVTFTFKEVKNWNDTVSLPLLPRADSSQVFAQLRKFPRLDLNELNQWRARPDRELDATNQKHLMDFEKVDQPEGFWPVYKGESFDLWTPDTGTYYAWADPKPAMDYIQSKRWRVRNTLRSAHFEFSRQYLQDQRTLPCYRPRIAFRDVTNRTNQRTVIPALVPPNVFITNKGPYFLWPRGNEQDQAFLLGILSSLPLDWYARRFVETNLNFFIINPFPIPRPSRESVLWQRVVELAGRLACPDERFAEWSQKVDVVCGPMDEAKKEDHIHELDAVVSHLYGLSESQLIHIFETFHEGWDVESRLSSVMHYYQAWRTRQ